MQLWIICIAVGMAAFLLGLRGFGAEGIRVAGDISVRGRAGVATELGFG
jgi:hypothetical protein